MQALPFLPSPPSRCTSLQGQLLCQSHGAVGVRGLGRRVLRAETAHDITQGRGHQRARVEGSSHGACRGACGAARVHI